MPLISLMKSNELGFHIAACISGEKNKVWNSGYDPNFPSPLQKGKWYLVEVGQHFQGDAGDYVYSIYVNGVKYYEEVNTIPTEFENMKVYASNKENGPAENTKIRNFKFKTEQEGAPGWTVTDGIDCYPTCGSGGHCEQCGTNGFCCAENKPDLNGDCTDEMIEAIKNSEYRNQPNHMCVALSAEESCSEFNIQKDIDCNGRVIAEIPVLDEGIAQCQDKG